VLAAGTLDLNAFETATGDGSRCKWIRNRGRRLEQFSEEVLSPDEGTVYTSPFAVASRNDGIAAELGRF